MAHSLSARKRVRQNAKAKARNRWRKISYRDAIREFNEMVHLGKKEEAQTRYKQITRLLDQVVSKGTIHKKTASRYKSRMALRLNSMNESKAA
jgi:small subunit ribosomal protein S20